MARLRRAIKLAMLYITGKLFLLLLTDVTWNSDNESLPASMTGQPRGDCPYPNIRFCSRGCATGQALDLDNCRNSIHVTSVTNIAWNPHPSAPSPAGEGEQNPYYFLVPLSYRRRASGESFTSA